MRVMAVTLLLAALAGARHTSSQKQPQTEPGFVQATAASPAGSGADPQVQILKDQLATIKEYDQRLQNTVLWSLGGVFLLIILVAGINWFANYRLYEKDLDRLRELIKTSSAEVRSQLQAEVTTFLSAAERTVNATEERLKSSLTEDIDALQKRVNGNLESLSKSVDSKVETARKQTRYEQLQANRKNSNFQAEYYERMGQPHYALSSWIAHLSAVIELGLGRYACRRPTKGNTAYPEYRRNDFRRLPGRSAPTTRQSPSGV